jgi:hypothetical protein
LPARWPLGTFFVLTFAFTWAPLPLARTRVVFSWGNAVAYGLAAVTVGMLAWRKRRET